MRKRDAEIIFLIDYLFSTEKIAMIGKMLSESDILDAIRQGEVGLPPVRISLAEVEVLSSAGEGALQPDACIDVAWNSRTYRFVAEIKVQASPKVFRDAIEQVQAYAGARKTRPMLVTTYLSPERLAELESQGVSGIDMSGNGVIVVPGEVIVFRTGNPNRYPAGRKIRNVYQGASSLVARVFMARPRYESVQGVLDEIFERGGEVSLGTVSKVLKALDEDLIIRRDGRASELTQPDELLDRLASAYRQPRVEKRKAYRWTGDRDELVEELAESRSGLVLTGEASVDKYAVMPREKSLQFYCTAIRPIEQRLREKLEESPQFPDLELIETRDPTVYFDGRESDGVRVSSPTQCWLELQAGDKRQADAAQNVRARILEELRSAG